MPVSKVSSIFRLLKQAVKGDEQDYTSLGIDKAIFLLSVPMILEMIMESLFAVVDVYFVSQLNDNDAIATIGLTESVLMLVYSIAIGLSMGATAMVARRVGEKDIQSAKVAAVQSIYIGIAFSFPKMGVEGAAIATNIGRGIGVLYQLYHLVYGKGLIKVSRKNLRLRSDIIVRLLKVSAGGAGQFLIASASWLFLVRIMSTFGSVAVAGYTIAIRLIVFAILPAWGMANASATLVGQNLGAGYPDRAEKSVWRAAFLNMIFLALVTVIFLVFAKPLLSFFTDDEAVLRNGIQCLQIVSLGYVFYAFKDFSF